MKRRTFVSPEAQNDIRETARWYEEREVGLGLRFLREVRTSLKRIKDDRLTFPIIEQDVRRALLHKFPYSIYFVSDRDAAQLLQYCINIAFRTLGSPDNNKLLTIYWLLFPDSWRFSHLG